jgi:hypothetical protein
LISFAFFLELSRLFWRWDKARSGFDPAGATAASFAIAALAIIRLRAALVFDLL